MFPDTQLFLIGAGELGAAFLPCLATLPNTSITVGVRSPDKYTHLHADKVSVKRLDIAGPSEELSHEFSGYDIVIAATGFVQDAGTLTKLARDILLAGRLRQAEGKGRLWFFPWQWGVDYDVTGDGDGLMPLFGEQKTIRDLLKAEAAKSNVKWTIVSTGIFMSFLFEQFWGIVDQTGDDHLIVRALCDWQHKITVTDVHDIGKVLARICSGDVEANNRVVLVAGDTVSYEQIAVYFEKTTTLKVKREEWTIPILQQTLSEDPEDQIKRYRLVFAKEGVWWDKSLTANEELGIPMLDVATYIKQQFAPGNAN